MRWSQLRAGFSSSAFPAVAARRKRRESASIIARFRKLRDFRVSLFVRIFLTTLDRFGRRNHELSRSLLTVRRRTMRRQQCECTHAAFSLMTLSYCTSVVDPSGESRTRQESSEKQIPAACRKSYRPAARALSFKAEIATACLCSFNTDCTGFSALQCPAECVIVLLNRFP